MLSDSGYKILQLINQERHYDILDMNTFAFLENCEYIAYDGQRRAYVTPRGDEACKEYEIQKETQQNTQKANETARAANNLSILALIVSSVLSIAAVIVAALC